jgi:hypothetical protein
MVARRFSRPATYMYSTLSVASSGTIDTGLEKYGTDPIGF